MGVLQIYDIRQSRFIALFRELKLGRGAAKAYSLNLENDPLLQVVGCALNRTMARF